ncbi:MAG: hypothetical protein DWQ31_14200 [Planctomycetota bacterium]|nr:MAG: hypothetical protein DWQ31_14200 [Planctomycetota bacterium]
MTYFCTPEGQVVHFVAGAVNAPELLHGMQWAVRAQQTAFGRGRTDKQTARRLMRLHLQVTGDDLETFINNLTSGNRQRYGEPGHDRWLTNRSPVEVHRYLAARPLVPLREIETEVFSTFADYDVRDEEDDARLDAVAAVFERCREARRPVVLVMTAERGAALSDSAAQRQIDKIRAEFVTLVLSIDELPALSTRIEIRATNGQERTGSGTKVDGSRRSEGQLYVFGHTGDQVDVVSISDAEGTLGAMRHALQLRYLEDAQAAVAQNEWPAAVRIAKRLRAWPAHPSIDEQVSELATRILDRSRARRALAVAEKRLEQSLERGRASLQKVAADYPETPEARTARIILAAIE